MIHENPVTEEKSMQSSFDTGILMFPKAPPLAQSAFALPTKYFKTLTYGNRRKF
jgi:hypothetical protein